MKGGKGFFVFPVHWLRAVDSIEMQAFNKFLLGLLHVPIRICPNRYFATDLVVFWSFDKISVR